MLASLGEEEEEGEAKITRCQSNSGILEESDGRTTRYCREVMEKIREVEMKMSPHALRPFSSTLWVAWMVGSVNLSMSLDSC